MSVLGSAAVFTRLSISPSAERQQQITDFKQKYATMEKTSTDTLTRLVLRKLYGLSVAKVVSIVIEMLNPPTADSLSFLNCLVRFWLLRHRPVHLRLFRSA